MSIWNWILAALILVSPLVTLVYVYRSATGSTPGSSERAVALYLGSRCVAFVGLAVVSFVWHEEFYLAVVAGATALTQALDVPIHMTRGERTLAWVSLAFVAAVVALMVMVGIT